MLRKLILAILAVIISSSAYAAVEIGDIIKDVLMEQRDGRLPWSFYAQSGSPVRWETHGIVDSKREGNAVLSVNGFIPEVLGKNIEHGVWTVRASGDKFGIRTLMLSNNSCFGSVSVSINCSTRLEQFPQSLNAAGIDSEVICEFGPGAAMSEIRRVRINGSAPAYLHSVVHAGSGGQTLDLNIIVKSTGNGTELKHATAICAFAFIASSGADSNIAYDYRYLIGQ